MPDQARLDLLLINPSSRKRVYQSLANELAAIEPPVWAGLMASFARRHGLSVDILDAEALGLSADETAAQVADARPRLAAVVVYGHQPSASTQVMPAAGEVCRAVKLAEPQQLVALVGGHVAALPRRTMEEEAADFVAAGEGLHALVELVQILRGGGDDFDQVSDLWYRRAGEIHASPRRASLVKDLDDTMPGIAWDLLPMELYRAHNWHCLDGLQRQPYAAIYTTLGCPYKCTFCCIQAPFKSGEAAAGLRASANSYRYWSPGRIADELTMLVERYGVRNVKFADEMFVLSRKHVEAICDLLIERELGLNIWAYARVDTVQEGLLEKLKRAGFNWLAFGIEAANARVRDGVDKGFSQADIARTINQVRAHGIRVIGNYIFGLPDDDRATMQETLDLALDLNCEFANFYCAMAYPGSRLYDEALAAGWRLPATWSGYSQHAVDTLPLPTRHVSAGEVLRFRDEAFQTYFTDPRYLDLIQREFGRATRDHIVEMTGHRLARQHY
ncbi:MAG: B12-binding domain-containing radical SAM protein [Pirellulales bacterium]|nr:B12-binding domain-containing radical SAM protein [Pirellulales bacterium]